KASGGPEPHGLAPRKPRRPQGVLQKDQGRRTTDRPHLRPWHLARHLPARPRRQRRRGVLRDAARRMAGRLPRVHPREDRQRPLPRSLGCRDRPRRPTATSAASRRGVGVVSQAATEFHNGEVRVTKRLDLLAWTAAAAMAILPATVL